MSKLLREEIYYKNRNYYLGLNYLTKNNSNYVHLLSCYEGISFRNLARFIKFDRTGKAFKLDNYLAKPKRYILTTNSKTIKGIMVTISLPEFYQEIEFEDYIIIATKSIEGFKIFSEHLSFTKKAEVVVFNRNHVDLAKDIFPVRKIHQWSAFILNNQKISYPVDTRIMNKNDITFAKSLSKKVPEESSPFRLLKLQLNGLPYRNYIFSSDNNPRVFIGVSQYSSRVYQINYLINSFEDNEFVSSALSIINRFIKTYKCKLICRIRKSELSFYEPIINKSNFEKLSEEYHLHYDFIN